MGERRIDEVLVVRRRCDEGIMQRVHIGSDPDVLSESLPVGRDATLQIGVVDVPRARHVLGPTAGLGGQV